LDIPPFPTLERCTIASYINTQQPYMHPETLEELWADGIFEQNACLQRVRFVDDQWPWHDPTTRPRESYATIGLYTYVNSLGRDLDVIVLEDNSWWCDSEESVYNVEWSPDISILSWYDGVPVPTAVLACAERLSGISEQSRVDGRQLQLEHNSWSILDCWTKVASEGDAQNWLHWVDVWLAKHDLTEFSTSSPGYSSGSEDSWNSDSSGDEQINSENGSGVSV
jgi:hypothetical protein